MKLLKKYYIYIFELIIGNIIFNFIYAIIKTLTFKNIGAISENFTENMITSFRETFLVYMPLCPYNQAPIFYQNHQYLKKVWNKVEKVRPPPIFRLQ